MSAPQSIQTIPLQLPIKGVNRRDPLARMDSLYTPWLLNWEPEPQYIRVRNGWQIHAIHTDTGAMVRSLASYDGELYAFVTQTSGNDKIYDVSTGTPVLSRDTGSNTFQILVPAIMYKRRLWFLPVSAPHQSGSYFDSSTWTTFAFDDAGSAIVRCGGPKEYKGRLYFSDIANATVFYSTLGGITGNVQGKIDLDPITRRPSIIIWHEVLSSPANREVESLLCFGTIYGGTSETFIYAGDNPDAANWEQVGRFEHAPVFGFEPVLSFNGDIWILTSSGIISVRRMQSYGQDKADSIYVSDTINPYIARLYREYYDATNSNGNLIVNTKPSMVHWPEENKVYVLIPGFIDRDDAYTEDDATLLVYNTISEAWCIQHIVLGFTDSIGGLTVHDNSLYFYVDNVVMKLNETSYKDEEFDNEDTFNEYTIQLESAWLNFQNTRKQKMIAGLDALIKTDFADNHVGMRAAADFGRKINDLSYQSFQDGYNNPFYNISVDGEYLQWRIEGTSDESSTDGFELYSMAMGLK